jgi:hypothetical protein
LISTTSRSLLLLSAVPKGNALGTALHGDIRRMNNAEQSRDW